MNKLALYRLGRFNEMVRVANGIYDYRKAIDYWKEHMDGIEQEAFDCMKRTEETDHGEASRTYRV